MVQSHDGALKRGHVLHQEEALYQLHTRSLVVPIHSPAKSRCAVPLVVQLSTIVYCRPLPRNWPDVTRERASALAGSVPCTRSGVNNSRRGSQWILATSFSSRPLVLDITSVA